MFDAHTHLQDSRLTAVFDEVVARAARAGITGICSCGTAPGDWGATARLACAAFPFTVVPGFGVHPWYAGHLPPDWLACLEEHLAAHPGAAVGEIGLDGVRGDVPPERQEETLAMQLGLAVRLQRPVVTHGARAWERLAEVLKPFARDLPGVMAHGFGGSSEQLRVFLGMGGVVSVSGSVCNPRAEKIREAARRIPDDRLLVETDAPDLFPPGGVSAGFGRDGKPLNQPANLARVLTELSALRNVPPETLAVLTRANAQRFFYGHTGHDRRQ